MAAERHYSPPEIPEPTLMETVLHHGLFFGAIFQLLCVLAIILPVSQSRKTDSDGSGTKTWEAVKKPKAVLAGPVDELLSLGISLVLLKQKRQELNVTITQMSAGKESILQAVGDVLSNNGIQEEKRGHNQILPSSASGKKASTSEHRT